MLIVVAIVIVRLMNEENVVAVRGLPFCTNTCAAHVAINLHNCVSMAIWIADKRKTTALVSLTVREIIAILDLIVCIGGDYSYVLYVFAHELERVSVL